MPYRIYQVVAATSSEQERAIDEHGNTSTYTVEDIRIKIPKEELWCGWSQLYAFLSLLYLPVLIDALWVYPPLKLMKTPVSAPMSESSTKEDKKPCWKELKDDVCTGPITFLCSLPFLACGLATAIFAAPAFALMLVFVRAVTILFECLASIVANLFAALMCKQKFTRGGRFGIQKTTADDGEEMWEACVCINHDDSDLLAPSAPFELGSVKRGDKIRVGFGPFETMCFFRSWTQLAAPV